MNLSNLDPNPLSFELLDTRQCMEVGPQLNEFENAIFGPDFACDYERFRPWLESGCLFYSAVCGEAVAGRSTILSVASVLVTEEESRERLLRGEIGDLQLQPWRHGSGGEPVAYFSSVVSANPGHLSAIYDSLTIDLGRFLGEKGVRLRSGFCVATGPAGFRHLCKNGFVPFDGPPYLGKYDVMTIHATTARARFWRLAFGLAPVTSGESDTVHIVVNPSVALPETVRVDCARPDEAREVERRLAKSKAERYRRLLDY